MNLATPVVHHPFQFHVGPVTLTGFGIAVLAAFFLAQYICEHELARRGQLVESAAMGDVTFAALVGTLIGAKIYFVGVLTHNPADLFSRGGFVFWGGFIGAVLACYLTIRWKKLPFLRFADAAGIGIAAGYAVGRTGCWAVGDDYGRPWDGPLAVAFPEGAPPSTVANMITEFHWTFAEAKNPMTVVSVIPTQLIEVTLGVVMFLIVWRLRAHRHAAGWLFGVYCVLAGAERFIVEFMRAKDDRFGPLGGLSVAQVIAIAIALTGVAVMTMRRNPDSLTPRPAS